MIRVLLPAFVLLLNTTPALADLTAEEVLADHLNLLGMGGLLNMTTTGTTKSVSGMTVAGFVGSYEDDQSRVEIRSPGMILTEQSDGSVIITYDDTLPITIHAAPNNDDPVTVTLNLKTKGLRHHVSGDLKNLQHDISFDTLTVGAIDIDPPEAADAINLVAEVAIAGLTSRIRISNSDPMGRSVDLNFSGLTLAMSALASTRIGVDTPGTTYDTTDVGDMDLFLSLSDVASRFGYTGGNLPRHTMDTTIGALRWDGTSIISDEEGGLDWGMTSKDFALSFDVQIDVDSFEADTLKALKNGQMISGAMNFANLAYEFGIDTPEGTIASATTSGASENRLSLSETGLTFFSSTVDSVFDLGGPALELPINQFGYTVAKSLIDLVIPLTPSEDAQPFRARLEMEDVATDDAIWNLFDPNVNLPRTPADLSFDLSGTTVVVSDVFAEDGSIPFRGTEAELSNLRLSFAGAEVTGSGRAEDISTPDKPAGMGELNMTLKGIHKLIDTAVDMGLLPNEQAMGARLGLGLIARPGDDANTLVSHIEMNEIGQIFANGQRIK